MKRGVLYFFLVSVLFISCNNNTRENNQQISKAKYIYDLKQSENDQTQEIRIGDIKYIPLETNQESLLGHVAKIMFRLNKFYIYDDVSHGIYVFDQNGKFLLRISKLGKGPGEYVQLTDFDVDDFGNIYIWDVMTRKLIQYSPNGEIINKFYFKQKVFLHFSVISQSKLLLSYVYDSGIFKSSMAIFDIKTSDYKEIIPGNEDFQGFSNVRQAFSNIYRTNQAIYFTVLYKPDIYKIDSLGFVSKLLSLQNVVIPNLEEVKRINEAGFNYKGFDYFKSINNVYENQDYLTFEISKVRFFKRNIISKKDWPIKIVDCDNDPRFFGYSKIRATTNNEFIAVLEPDFFVKEDWKEEVEKSDLRTENKRIILRSDKNSNPILMLFNFSKL